MKEPSEITKAVLAQIVCIQYLDYLGTVKKKILFEHQGELITPKLARKILKSFSKIKQTKNWKVFIKKFAKYALEDKEFPKWLEDMEMTCEECGYVPIKREKCSRYHIEWNKLQEDMRKDVGTNTKTKPYGVYREKCSQCGHEYFIVTGEDNNPEEGLRN